MFPFLWLVAMRWAAPRLDGAPRGRRLLGLLGLAGLWIVLDWVRMWLFSGFPWLPLAAAFWKFPLLLQLAEWTGQWGVTFLIVLLNLGLVCGTGAEPLEPGGVPERRWKRIWWPARFGPEIWIPLLLFQGVILLAFQLALRESSHVQPGLRVGFVQPWTPADQKWDKESAQKNWDNLVSLTLGMRTRGVDFVLWPEAAPPFLVTGPNTSANRAAIQRVVDAVGQPLVFGAVGAAAPAPGSTDSPGDTDGIYVMNPGTGLEPVSYAKRHLVPFGEYVPMRSWLPFLGKVVPGRDTIPGDHPQVLPLTLSGGRTKQLGPLVCYEDVFPNLARDQVRPVRKCWLCSPTMAGMARAAGRSSTPRTRSCAPSKRAGPCCAAATTAGAE
jgi:apolipoprotein N-acyltransferase